MRSIRVNIDLYVQETPM